MMVVVEHSTDSNLSYFVNSPGSPFEPSQRVTLVDPAFLLDDLNARNDRTYSSQKIEEYFASWDLSNYYSKSQVDNFFSGENSGKKLVDWGNIINKTGEGFTYTHNQTIPASIWTINHNLGFHPGGVLVIDSAGETCNGVTQVINSNQVVLVFSSAFSGKAYIS